MGEGYLLPRSLLRISSNVMCRNWRFNIKVLGQAYSSVAECGTTICEGMGLIPHTTKIQEVFRVVSYELSTHYSSFSWQLEPLVWSSFSLSLLLMWPPSVFVSLIPSSSLLRPPTMAWRGQTTLLLMTKLQDSFSKALCTQ